MNCLEVIKNCLNEDFSKRGKIQKMNTKNKIQPYIHHAKYYETDQMGIIHHSNYIRWMEDARMDAMNQYCIIKMHHAFILTRYRDNWTNNTVFFHIIV